jgi:hemerythrin superfamily protein
VRALLGQGLDYAAAGQRLGIPAGQVYLIATGRPADGSDSPPAAQVDAGELLPSSQHLASPPHENPTSSTSVKEWIKARVAADAPMRAAAERRTAEPAEPGTEGSQDLVMVLTRQHNQVRALQEQLETLPSHKTGGSPADLEARKSVVDLITVHLARHETAEEEYLWPAVRKALPDGDALADTAVQQEQEGTETLAELGKLDPGTDEFDEAVEELVLQLRKHVAHEEKVFLRLREAVGGDEREELGKKLLAASKRAPTRPHPHAPKRSGAAVKAAAPGAAALDKLRDAAGERPADRKGRPEGEG